jgi:aryl-alcohol dehydrogenase-like predicted oxidoreductase
LSKDYVPLGDSGLEISKLVFGTALTIGTERVDQMFSDEMIELLWEGGIRTFDTSNNYGEGKAELLLGKSLKKYPRHDLVLTTKGSWPVGSDLNSSGLGRKHIFNSLENSLIRLDMDFIDVYFAHRFSEGISLEQIVRTFNSLITQGKILHWGVSEWPLSALEECFKVCERNGLEGPVVQQNVFSYALHPSRENGLLQFANDHGMGFIGYSPLAQGALTGKYLSGIPKDSRIDKEETIGYFKTRSLHEQVKEQILKFLNITHKYELNPTHAAIAWVLKEGIVPLFGASSKEQILENLKALDFSAPKEFWSELN